MSGYRLDGPMYDLACDLAGAALLRRLPGGRTLYDVTVDRVWDRYRSGVYMAADRDNRVVYVGSSARAASAGLTARIKEHVNSGRARPWVRLMLVPLHSDTDRSRVRVIEGSIGLVFRPSDSRRLPAI